MNTLDKEYQSVLTELDDIDDKNKIYLYKKYNQKEVFQLSCLDVNNILQLERQGIHLSPQEYIDLGGG